MATATVLSRAQCGMDAPLVRVEVDLDNGLPKFTIVGLPEAVVKESRERVRSAVQNCGFKWPPGRITVNLSPADLPKEGGRFDLPIAVGILAALDEVPDHQFAACELYGELSLTGQIQPMRGALLAAVAAARCDRPIIVPEINGAETLLVTGCRVAVAAHLRDLVAHARGEKLLSFALGNAPPAAKHDAPDVSDVRGQAQAKRALEIAAAGEHSLLMIGPPGAGKSMLAQRLPGLLPGMSESESLEVAAVRSLAGLPQRVNEWRVRPFRRPHHTTSAVALVGGGSSPRPGEISLAHNGVLFLDELPEFDRHVLEVLREPIETGTVTISRAARQAEFPASFQFVGAMNPCPCGYLGDAQGRCRCTCEQVDRYRARLSGPLLDRLDLHIEMPRVPPQVLHSTSMAGESSAQVAARVCEARRVQVERQSVTNARLSNRQVERFCRPTAKALALLDRAAATLGLSARAYHRVLKVARTVADLAAADMIEVEHVGEAMAMRRLDRRTAG